MSFFLISEWLKKKKKGEPTEELPPWMNPQRPKKPPRRPPQIEPYLPPGLDKRQTPEPLHRPGGRWVWVPNETEPGKVPDYLLPQQMGRPVKY